MRTTLFNMVAGIMLMAVCLQACAKTGKMPKGRFISYEFSRGGGMNPLDYTIYLLRYDEETGKRMLTVSGDCQGEEITIEVGQEVMDSCFLLIEKHHLERSKGFYQPKFEVLDAPSSRFCVSFTDPYGSFSGSGDMPDFLWKGIGDVNSYLKRVVGDRKAEGHVDRIYGPDDIAGMRWTDGTSVVVTPEDNADPLKAAFRLLAAKVADDTRNMGYEHYHDGDQHYLVIYDYNNDLCRIFYSLGSGVDWKKWAQEQVAVVKSHRAAVGDSVKWPVVNERFLSHPMLNALSVAQLEEMVASIHKKNKNVFNDMRPHTDIGEVNMQLLESELKARKKQ